MKKAIHFGAGNIGRGFIGLLLNKSGYEVTFVDVNADLVNDINELGKYNIEIVGDNPEIIQVDNVKAINSATNLDDLIDAIVPGSLKYCCLDHVCNNEQPFLNC